MPAVNVSLPQSTFDKAAKAATAANEASLASWIRGIITLHLAQQSTHAERSTAFNMPSVHKAREERERLEQETQQRLHNMEQEMEAMKGMIAELQGDG